MHMHELIQFNASLVKTAVAFHLLIATPAYRSTCLKVRARFIFSSSPTSPCKFVCQSGLMYYRYKRRLHVLWSLLNGGAEVQMLREKVLQGMGCDNILRHQSCQAFNCASCTASQPTAASARAEALSNSLVSGTYNSTPQWLYVIQFAAATNCTRSIVPQTSDHCTASSAVLMFFAEIRVSANPSLQLPTSFSAKHPLVNKA